jgi:tetratricopeptide (TPR) repeat protein
LKGGGETASLIPADAGETLVLVSEFANFGGEALGYNVAGRLSSALREVFDQAGLQDVRIARSPEVLMEGAGAAQAGEEARAALVIWGEYDSGRVIVHLSTPDLPEGSSDVQRSWLVDDSALLSTTINADLPHEVRWMALYTLGRLHLLQEEWDFAEAALEQALNESLNNSSAQGAVHYYLGTLESLSAVPDFDRAIAHFSEALTLQPGMAAALRNRGVTYLY